MCVILYVIELCLNFFNGYIKTPIPALVDFNSKIKTNQNKQQYFTDNHYL